VDCQREVRATGSPGVRALAQAATTGGSEMFSPLSTTPLRIAVPPVATGTR
jgi:hypothetical protein